MSFASLATLFLHATGANCCCKLIIVCSGSHCMLVHCSSPPACVKLLMSMLSQLNDLTTLMDSSVYSSM